MTAAASQGSASQCGRYNAVSYLCIAGATTACKRGFQPDCSVLIYISADLARPFKCSRSRAIEVIHDEARGPESNRYRRRLRDAIEGIKAFAFKAVRIGKSGEDRAPSTARGAGGVSYVPRLDYYVSLDHDVRRSMTGSTYTCSSDTELVSTEWEPAKWERSVSERVRALASQLPEELFDRILGGMVWRAE